MSRGFPFLVEVRIRKSLKKIEQSSMPGVQPHTGSAIKVNGSLHWQGHGEVVRLFSLQHHQAFRELTSRALMLLLTPPTPKESQSQKYQEEVELMKNFGPALFADELKEIQDTTATVQEFCKERMKLTADRRSTVPLPSLAPAAIAAPAEQEEEEEEHDLAAAQAISSWQAIAGTQDVVMRADDEAQVAGPVPGAESLRLAIWSVTGSELDEESDEFSQADSQSAIETEDEYEPEEEDEEPEEDEEEEEVDYDMEVDDEEAEQGVQDLGVTPPSPRRSDCGSEPPPLIHHPLFLDPSPSDASDL
jgi:hypothetical protein